MTITSQDADLLSQIQAEFSHNVIDNYEGDALKAFRKNAGIITFMRLVKDAYAEQRCSTHPDSEKRARATAKYSTTALPILTKTFGEQALLDALPDKARTQHVVDLCREAGSPELADLCAKAMNQGPKQ